MVKRESAGQQCMSYMHRIGLEIKRSNCTDHTVLLVGTAGDRRAANILTPLMARKSASDTMIPVVPESKMADVACMLTAALPTMMPPNSACQYLRNDSWHDCIILGITAPVFERCQMSITQAINTSQQWKQRLQKRQLLTDTLSSSWIAVV